MQTDMNLVVLYFSLFLVGFIGWIIYYRTRDPDSERDQQDAVALGTIMAAGFIVLASLAFNLAILSVAIGSRFFKSNYHR